MSWKNEKQRHQMAAKGIKTKQIPAYGRYDKRELVAQQADEIWEEIHEYIDGHNITVMPTDLDDWPMELSYNSIIPHYFFNPNDNPDYTFMKKGYKFDNDEYMYLDLKFKEMSNLHK